MTRLLTMLLLRVYRSEHRVRFDLIWLRLPARTEPSYVVVFGLMTDVAFTREMLKILVDACIVARLVMALEHLTGTRYLSKLVSPVLRVRRWLRSGARWSTGFFGLGLRVRGCSWAVFYLLEVIAAVVVATSVVVALNLIMVFRMLFAMLLRW